MKEETMSKESVMPGFSIKEKLVGVEEVIVESGKNRNVKNDPGLSDLAASIEKDGVLQPILLRARAEADETLSLVLIAGERRLAAAKKAGLKLIPSRIFTCTDEEVDRLRAVENVHRKDLNPIDEALAFARIREKFADEKAVAALVSKPLNYVHRALALLVLPNEVKDPIASGDLTPEHGHQIARAPEKVWPALVKFVTTKNWHGRHPGIDELKAEIERRIERDLKAAIFPKDEAYAGEIACSVCPYNTGNQSSLFDGAESGKCTNPTCFAKKEKLAVQEFASSKEKSMAGITYLGPATVNDYQREVRGAVVLKDENLADSQVKKMMKEHPEWFGWHVTKPSRNYGRKPKVVVVAVDPKAVPKELKQEAHGPERDWRQEQHIRYWVSLELLAAANKAFRTDRPSKEHLEHMALASIAPQNIEDGLGILGIIYGEKVGKITSEKEFLSFVRAMSKPELIHAAWLGAVSRHGSIIENAKALGVDVKKVSTKATEAALKDWEEKKKVVDTQEKNK